MRRRVEDRVGRPERENGTGGKDRTAARTAAALALVVLVGAAAPVAGQDLPGGLELTGGTYLYHYAPLDLPGADETTEIYALFLNLDRTEGPWDIHVQGRWRDTRLRSFYPSNVWLQEAWVAYEPEPGLTVRAGKLYQRIGRFWDGSFFGNVHYFDGLKLDPEFGAEVVLRTPVGGAGAEAEVYVQGLVGSDRVNGALAGRDLEGEEELEEKGAAAGLRMSFPAGRMLGREVRVSGALSGLAERIEAPEASGVGAEGSTLEHVAADVELSVGEAGRLYLEWTRRASGGPGHLADLGPAAAGAGRGVAGSRASWWLAGARVRFGRLGLRYNLSTARYDDGGFREWIHQPGLTYRADEAVSLLLEYDDWRRRPIGAAPAPAGDLPVRDTRLDRSLNLVMLLTF